MKKQLLMAALALCATQVQAANLSKSYLEIGYSTTEFTDNTYFDKKTDLDLLGHQISLSYEFENGFYSGLHFKRHRDTFIIYFLDQDVDYDENLLELGYVLNKTEKGRLSVGAYIGEMDIAIKDNNSDANIYRLYTEYDHGFNKYFSAFAKVGYESIDGDNSTKEDGFWAQAGIRAHLGASSLSWGFSRGEVTEQIAFAYRYSF
ncbi:hypothetical protein [Pseudoalteromonas luteoviolacea]|uniref:Outer membrane protein beta-barrel domain-containing protein n=1 Tax=Pseudoalteromonas luteoviolacea (strain 2ta16) TaxID=1353533 RepID=V4I2S6_PSEL2|nr:hypothetical protein [Pseudoalteromonas luteoviolacea]ESP94544.1 hypothetical protein PL2TA16_00544 [Pseudoalteromonas luteoviolacea 2ta16]KZN32238.1 hypothetical protein N483_03570 [Pseudoalteromonas luteoviolacea NCIMB 1944]